MESMLIVSSMEKAKSLLCEWAKTGSVSQVYTADSGSEARQWLIDNECDLLVINAPLRDEFGHELALMASESTTAGVVLLVKSELFDEIADKVEDAGVFMVEKPLNCTLYFQALRLASASTHRIRGLQSENEILKKKIEEIKLVDRAKRVLMQYLSMNEPQAHRYIEKQAMDMRMSRMEIAQSILRTYET